ncbi:MAG: N,N-dimethylformamidase beta subunit family domain-containing protein [Leucobacter sp.]
MTTEIFAYVDRMDYKPGDSVQVYLSSSQPQQVNLSLVRPHASGETEALNFHTAPVAQVASQSLTVDAQHTFNGSFGIAEHVSVPVAETFSAAALVWPTRIAQGEQPILNWEAETGSFSLRLSAEGHLSAVVRGADGAEHTAEISHPIIERQWFLVAAHLTDGQLSIAQIPVRSTDPNDVDQLESNASSALITPTGGNGTMLIGADHVQAAPNGATRSQDTFNGKIEAPLFSSSITNFTAFVRDLSDAAKNRDPRVLSGRIAALQQDAIAAWSFDSDFATDRATQVVAGQPELVLVGAPARGMTGHNWTGEHLDFRYAPQEYGAIHFHEDDLEDAAWAVSAQIQLPVDLPSGIYAIHAVGAEGEDHAPVFVRRAADSTPADVLFLAPTFSYLAYANSRLAEELDYESGDLSDLILAPSLRDEQVYAHAEFGMSLYDHHVDGSGNCYSTSLRPIPNMRWDFRSALQSAPRHFAADLAWTGWFDHQGIDFDVLSDHGLHESGATSLSGYRLVITGSHPEYWSGDMLDSVEKYLDGGGSLAYVGGNGFYWVTSASAERPHLLEVRRGQQGIRTWEGEPGEGVSAQSNEPGGLWRLRGRAPNKLVGVGMAAQGWDMRTPGFERTGKSRDPRVARLFEGIGDEIIGDFGLVLNGAAGDEIDRADLKLGTPRHALVVAQSQQHSKYYLAALEEITTPTPNINGTNNPNVRADIVFHERAGGGFVVSTSAITWTGSMAYNRFDNNVSQFMRNVVDLAVKPNSDA